MDTLSTQANPPTADLLSTDEAARFLGLASGTLRFYRHLGKGPKSFICGRLVKYRRSDLVAWLEAQEAATARGGHDIS
ncbi:MAG: helix-turn-helix transcriptional regulator [Segniliparus sp.]|uniref:helix-turn-helix transcriptional regulator n=1 Tax=Segniliparus sp. TaxID=2804064 RepID=UPI003F4158D2